MDAKLGAASLFDFEVSEKFVNDVLFRANLACQQSRYLPQVWVTPNFYPTDS